MRRLGFATAFLLVFGNTGFAEDSRPNMGEHEYHIYEVTTKYNAREILLLDKKTGDCWQLTTASTDSSCFNYVPRDKKISFEGWLKAQEMMEQSKITQKTNLENRVKEILQEGQK